MEEKLKILLCEDDENLGMLLREYLQAKNFECKLCPDGEIGYREFFKEKYDICVLDVMMPKKDGFTLAQEIRQSNAEVPIIFLTAKTLKEDILEGFKLGADDYITKPFSMEELVMRIEAILRRVKGKKNKESTLYHIGRFTFDTREAVAHHRREADQAHHQRRTSCWPCSAPTPTRSCSATMRSRPFGSTTTTSTPDLWMSISRSCAST